MAVIRALVQLHRTHPRRGRSAPCRSDHVRGSVGGIDRDRCYRPGRRDIMTPARHTRVATVGCGDAPRALCRSPRAVPPRLAHQAFYLPYGLGETHEDRPRHDGMTDVQLPNLRNRCDGLDVTVIETVTGVDCKTAFSSLSRGIYDTLEFHLPSLPFAAVRVTPRV
jgi:hypothetical protein